MDIVQNAAKMSFLGMKDCSLESVLVSQLSCRKGTANHKDETGNVPGFRFVCVTQIHFHS